VIAEIERRQSAMLREHAEHLGELTDKLNGLIGYMDS
jgi:hypothetical protein